MMYPICKNCKNCKIMPPWLVASSFLFPGLSYHARHHAQLLRLLRGRTAVPKLPPAMGNEEPSLNWLLPSQEFSTSRMKKRLRLWLTKLISLLFFTDGRRSEWLYLFLKCHLYLGLLCFFFLFFLLLGCKSCGKGQQKSQQKEHPPVHDVSLLSSGYVCCSHGFCLFVLGQYRWSG